MNLSHRLWDKFPGAMCAPCWRRSLSSMDLRKIEEAKIECARKFFAKITSDQVKYDVVNSYGKLMELVK